MKEITLKVGQNGRSCGVFIEKEEIRSRAFKLEASIDKATILTLEIIHPENHKPYEVKGYFIELTDETYTISEITTASNLQQKEGFDSEPIEYYLDIVRKANLKV